MPIPAAFVARPNRFVACVGLEDGTLAAAHLANTARLTGLLEPGRPLLLGAASLRARRGRRDDAPAPGGPTSRYRRSFPSPQERRCRSHRRPAGSSNPTARSI